MRVGEGERVTESVSDRERESERASEGERHDLRREVGRGRTEERQCRGAAQGQVFMTAGALEGSGGKCYTWITQSAERNIVFIWVNR